MEAGGDAGGVRAAEHLFLPMAIVAASGSLLIGEFLDRSADPKAFLLFQGIYFYF